MPVKVLLRPVVEKPALSQGHGDNNYRGRYHDNREQGELVDNRIYVGGLGYRIEERDLFYFFDTIGPVQHVGIITEGGNSKGYGFVTFNCKEVVDRLLNTKEGLGLVLKGRNLYIGPARQRQGQQQHYNGRGRGQGLGGYYDDYSKGENSPGKESSENPETEPVESSHHEPASYDLLTDPGMCYPYEPSAQLPCYPEPSSYPLSYPFYYPQYLAYPTTTPDMSWYPTNQYQDVVRMFQDPYTGQVYPMPYSGSYSSFPEGSYTYQYPLVVPVDNNFQPSGPYWPEQPTLYPVIYPYTQPAPQHTTPGEIFQPVPGYQEPVLPGTPAFQNYPHDDQNTSNQPGYSEDPHELGDSGFQDMTRSFLDSTSCQDQPHGQGRQAAQTQGGHEDDNQRVRVQSQSNKPSTPPRFQQQKTSANLSQEQQNYTKLKPPENDRNIAVENRGNSNRGGGRDFRVYPSPYKSFSPFTGNLPSRQFPFPAGPRPYFPGQGRGRGRIWGGRYNNVGGRREDPGWTGPRKNQGKKGVGNDNQKIGSKENTQGSIDLSGNQPDILQGPMEKLELK